MTVRSSIAKHGGTMLTSVALLPREPPPPSFLGRYEVGAKVGVGGMANVYVGRGVSDDGVEELVALKVMLHEYGRDPKYLRMFSDEAKILARVSHPNVIRTIESGITSEHRFIVMELLAGRTLADVWDLLAVRGERLAIRLGAWICARVADGLHTAHDLTDGAGVPLSIVHRDVNPSNIFLTHAGVPKLIDFGLAKARVRRTQSADGIVKGKVPYLAPEQISRRPIDRRIDLYALGTTLWECGTMARLFKRDTDVATLTAIREAKIPDPRELVEGYPDRLAAIVLRALARDPDERYATAGAMKEDLDAFVDDERGEMSGQLAVLVSRLFPGEARKHSVWKDDAIATRDLATVPPPPMPVPVALSNLPSSEPEVVLLDGDVELIEE
jgi:serine/threonine-protein kinase